MLQFYENKISTYFQIVLKMQNNLVYLQKMKQFFISNGKKNVLENVFRTFLMNWAVSNKGDLTQILNDAKLNSLPYIKLRTRRKGKRAVYKIGFLEKEESLRKGLLAFSKNFKENKGTNFTITLEKELGNLSSGKSSIINKRDELHRIALENAPFSWTIRAGDNTKK